MPGWQTGLIAEFKAGPPPRPPRPSKPDAASARITELEAENAKAPRARPRLTALAVEMSLETGSTATVIPLTR
jgi:hypothetical protein